MNYERKKDVLSKIPAPFAIILLLFSFAFQIVSAAKENQTIDETVHIMSGVTILQTGLYAFNREHPPLVKILSGVPVWLAGVRMDTSRQNWQNRDQ